MLRAKDVWNRVDCCCDAFIYRDRIKSNRITCLSLKGTDLYIEARLNLLFLTQKWKKWFTVLCNLSQT